MRTPIIQCTLILLLLPLLVGAQQSNKVTKTYFQDPAVEINTPVFAKKCGYTTYEEMKTFVSQLEVTHPSLLKVEQIGTTQQGRSIPMIKVSQGNSTNKLRILYLGRVHGNEPSGTEALLYFMRQLLEDEQVKALLDHADFYLIPMVNIDGGESNNRTTANGVDMNRDQSVLSTPEAQALQGIAHRIQPHVVVDFHDFQPIRSDFAQLSSDVLSVPWDVMFLYSSNPNVHPSLRSLVQDVFIANAGQDLDKHQLTHHTYYTSADDFGHVYLNVGGASPRSTSNMFALKNSVSMLMEIRGLGLKRISIKRRVYTGYQLALSFANTAIANAEQLRKATSLSEEDKADIAVRFSAPRQVLPFTFLDMINNRMVVLDVPARISADISTTLSRPMPKAYYILASETRAINTLLRMGVEVSTLESPATVPVQAYTVVTRRESAVPIGGAVYPVDVTTTISDKTAQLPAGTYRIDTRQRYSRLIGTMLEPESSNGFVNYGLIVVGLNQEIPVYREN